ncbi:LptF/LptG family permease [Acetobacteraceae bacterium ESL0709]|nr:LptF/LptG family permease [Acetobacteraceae bacterium ESL0697]MDF7678597.1 LptF/LptG family permease [Acetobacteraceae bacterium ESL0709]
MSRFMGAWRFRRKSLNAVYLFLEEEAIADSFGYSRTLSYYVARRFLVISVLIIMALTFLISLFDFIDLLRRAASHPAAGFGSVLEIAGLHIPYYALYVLPFAMLLAGIVCFSGLARSSELVVARGAGVSAWQILISPIICAIMVGVFFTTVLSPLSSAMYSKADRLDARLLKNESSTLDFRQDSLWIWQGNQETKGSTLFHLKHLHLEKERLKTSDITLFDLDSRHHILQRIEAPTGELFKGEWSFQNSISLTATGKPRLLGTIHRPASLSLKQMLNHAAPADTLSVWALPHAIHLLSQSGFSTIQMKLRFQSLLALPFLAGTMVLVSAGFSMRPSRRGGIAQLLASGVLTGFALFAISKIAEQLGKSGALPPLMAAWAPTLAGLCVAMALLLFMEDG